MSDKCFLTEITDQVCSRKLYMMMALVYLRVVVELVAHGVDTERVLLVAHVCLQLMLCRATVLRLRSYLQNKLFSNKLKLTVFFN